MFPLILSKLFNISNSGSDATTVGDGLHLHKHDKSYRVQKLEGNGLCLAAFCRR